MKKKCFCIYCGCEQECTIKLEKSKFNVLNLTKISAVIETVNCNKCHNELWDLPTEKRNEQKIFGKFNKWAIKNGHQEAVIQLNKH